MDEREIVLQNALSSAEVAEILEVSRQTVTNYVNEGKLIPLKKSMSGHIFYRPDVMRFKHERLGGILYKNNRMITEYYDITHKTVKYIRDNLAQFDNFCKVQIYFNEFDAMMDGFYRAKEPFGDSLVMHKVRGPNFVIRNKYDEEWWFSGICCGYSGTGPHGSESILRMIGVDQNLIDKLFTASEIEYVKSSDGWQVVSYKERGPSLDVYGTFVKNTVDVDIYLKNDNLVLVQKYGNHWDIDISNTLQSYSKFIDKVESIYVYRSLEAARESGYWNPITKIVYQVIIKDRSGRELWLYYPMENYDSISSKKDLVELIQECGFQSSYINKNKNFLEQIKHWIFKNNSNEYANPIIIQHE